MQRRHYRGNIQAIRAVGNRLPRTGRTYATCQIRLESTHQNHQTQEDLHDHKTSNAPPTPGPAGARARRYDQRPTPRRERQPAPPDPLSRQPRNHHRVGGKIHRPCAGNAVQPANRARHAHLLQLGPGAIPAGQQLRHLQAGQASGPGHGNSLKENRRNRHPGQTGQIRGAGHPGILAVRRDRRLPREQAGRGQACGRPIRANRRRGG